MSAAVFAVAPASAAEGLECMHAFDRAGEDALNAMANQNAAVPVAQRRRINAAGMNVLMARLRSCAEVNQWSERAIGYAANYRIWRLIRQRTHAGLPYFTTERRAMEAAWTEAELTPLIEFARAGNEEGGREFPDIPEARLRQLLPNAAVIAAMRRAGLGRHVAAADLVRVELYASLMAEDFAQRFGAAE